MVEKILYVMSLGAQKELIDKLCFDKCGKVHMGGIEIEGGMFVSCWEKDCEYGEKTCQLNGRLHGNIVKARKLKVT